VEVDTLGPISTTLTVRVWMTNQNFQHVLSDVKKRVRHALQNAEVSPPVPVPAPAVAPWQPPPEKNEKNEAIKPN
jgi:hypothetical protein